MNGIPFDPYELAGYKIIRPPRKRMVTFSELRIAPNKFIFSAVALADLNYPPHVCILYSEEKQQLLVFPSEETEMTMPFLPPEEEHIMKSLTIGHTALVKALRYQMKWSAKGTYRIQGMRIPDSNALAFDLKTAACGKQVREKIDPEKFLDSCPSFGDIIRIENNPNDVATYTPLALLPPA